MNIDLPLSQTNPEAARHLALSTYYMRQQDFRRAINYARLPTNVGDGLGFINLLSTVVLRREFAAAIELSGLMFAKDVHHSTRKGILESVLPALYFQGAAQGDCSEAYETAHELAGHCILNPHLPRWQGQPLRERSLLVSLSEAGLGGFGDYIMWARFLPFVADLRASIVVQCPQPLARLFLTVPGVVSTCGYEDRPVCDFAANIMELPHLLGMQGVPTANPFQVQRLSLPEKTHNVAINWGASWTAQYMDRACALAEYMPFMQLPETTLYAVQKGAHQKQLYPPPVGLRVLDLAPELGDFLDTAVALSGMDAVVTTDNVVANLACTLGLPAFVLAPSAANWRWGAGGQAPWFPSARVYQQEVAGDWGRPIAKLTADLAHYLRTQARALPKATESVQPEVQA